MPFEMPVVFGPYGEDPLNYRRNIETGEWEYAPDWWRGIKPRRPGKSDARGQGKETAWNARPVKQKDGRRGSIG